MSGIEFWPERVELTMAAGGGLVDDFSAPEFRAVGGLTWSLSPGREGGAVVDLTDSMAMGSEIFPMRVPTFQKTETAIGMLMDAKDNDADGLVDAKTAVHSTLRARTGMRMKTAVPTPTMMAMASRMWSRCPQQNSGGPGPEMDAQMVDDRG